MNGKFGVIGTLDKWKQGELPGNQMVNIVLNSYSTLKDESICISPQLVNDDEIDHCINGLIHDLEKARSAAKRNIARTNSKIRSG